MRAVKPESSPRPGYSTVLTRFEPDAAVDCRQQRRLTQGCYQKESLTSGMEVVAGRTLELVDCRVSGAVRPATAFIMVLEGALRFEYGDQSFQLDAGEGLVVHLSRTEVYRRQLTSGLKLAKVHVVLQPQWWRNMPLESPASRFLEQLASRHLGAWRWQLSPVQMDICRMLLEVASESDELLRRLRSGHLASGLILDLLQQREFALQPESGRTGGQAGLTPDVERTLLLIEQCLQQPFRVDEIARRVGVSTRVLQRRFKQQTGLTLLEFRRQRCLDRARQLLEESSLSIGEIAHQVGFGHVSNFTTAYRRRFGLTPAEQRRRS